jgi:hypothetical protein
MPNIVRERSAFELNSTCSIGFMFSLTCRLVTPFQTIRTRAVYKSGILTFNAAGADSRILESEETRREL